MKRLNRACIVLGAHLEAPWILTLSFAAVASVYFILSTGGSDGVERGMLSWRRAWM